MQLLSRNFDAHSSSLAIAASRGYGPRITSDRQTASPAPMHYAEPMIAAAPPSRVFVNEFTAMNYSAVFRCIALISATVAGLPWGVFEADGNKRIARPDHPVDLLLSTQPNPEMAALHFRTALMGHVLGWGNGYAEIVRNRGGEVVALWPIEPYRVAIKRTDSGQLYYQISNPDGAGTVNLPPERIFHLRGLSFDGIVGYSPIRLARDSIALGIAMERFGGSFL